MRNVQSSPIVQTVPVVPAKPSCVSFTVSGILSMHPVARASQPPGIATVPTSRSNARHIPTIHCDVIPRIADKIRSPPAGTLASRGMGALLSSRFLTSSKRGRIEDKEHAFYISHFHVKHTSKRL